VPKNGLSAELLAPLVAAGQSGDVTLVYGAKDEQHNQAVVIKQILSERLALESEE
jgi:uncharacterized protein YeaO (DUF488 family)